MTRFDRCPECNRWKATERQFDRWCRWCYRAHWLWKLTPPLWWRLDTRCLQWHDCPGNYENDEQRHVRRWVVRLFHVRWGDA